MEKELSRRDFLARALALGLAGVGASAVLTACGNAEQKPEQKPATPPAAPKAELKCDDVAALSEEDKGTRTNNGYVSKSTTPGKACDNCQLYQPGAPDACGACTLVKGPIHPKGYCRVWVKKA